MTVRLPTQGLFGGGAASIADALQQMDGHDAGRGQQWRGEMLLKLGGPGALPVRRMVPIQPPSPLPSLKAMMQGVRIVSRKWRTTLRVQSDGAFKRSR